MKIPTWLIGSKKPKNWAEAEFYDLAKARGWKLTKRGWPDFFCVRWSDSGEPQIMLVEIKSRKHHRLKSSQQLVLSELARYKVPCYRWAPGLGLLKIGEEETE